jgi:hypothetical protein
MITIPATVLSISLMTSAAFAASLPLTGMYGDDYGCKTATLSETSAVAASLPISGSYGTADSCSGKHHVDLLIDKTGIWSLDKSCTPSQVHGNRVQLDCSIEGGSYHRNATIRENIKAGTLTYSDGGTVVTLHRCP